MTSFTIKSKINLLPDGTYVAVLDEKYKKMELNDFEFTVQNNQFVIKKADKLETFEMEWLDENSFVVKGYTESVSPNTFEQNLLKDYRPTFNIFKNNKNEYKFTIGTENEKEPILAGKLVQTVNQK